MRTIYRDIVSALIFSKDGKLLMGMKDSSKGGVYSDCWHIPGGGIDQRENKIDALRREIIEETGIDISPYKITLVDNSGSGESEKILKDTGEEVLCKMKFFVYKVEVDDREAGEIKIKLSDDLVKIEWIDMENLKNYKLTPPSVKLFTKLKYSK